MTPFSFIHAADLHLDSPFIGVTGQSPQLMDVLRESTFGAFDALINLCIERRVRFLVVAGDVFDAADRSLRAQIRFCAGLQRLSDNDIWTFLVHGEEDPPASWSSTILWPERVTVFRSSTFESVEVPGEDRPVAAVSGMSIERADDTRLVRDRLAATQRRDGLFHIGLLHGDFSGETLDAVSIDDLAATGLSYWALGHRHQKEILSIDPIIAHPGTIQGRSAAEPGEHGCFLVHVDDAGKAELEFCPLDAVRWLRAEIDISDLDSKSSLVAELEETIADLGRQASRSVLANIHIVGTGPLYSALRSPVELAELLELGREIGMAQQPFIWLEGLTNRAHMDLDQRREESDLLGQLLRITHRARVAGVVPDDLRGPLTELYSHNTARHLLHEPSQTEMLELLLLAEQVCVDLLEGAP